MGKKFVNEVLCHETHKAQHTSLDTHTVGSEGKRRIH